MRKIILSAAICTIMAGVAGCGAPQGTQSGSNAAPQETVTEATTAAPEATTEAATEEVIPVKTSAQIGDWDVKIKGSEVVDRVDDDYSYFEPDEGNQYFVVEMSVENKGKQADSFLSTVSLDGDLNARLVYGAGYEFTQTSLLGYSQNILDESINPLTTKKGKLVFEVPQDVAESDGPFILRIYNAETDLTFAVN